MSEPVMAPVWTFLFLREMISPMSVAGCVIVIATLLIYNISASKKEG
jgi:drug/metabolite transporter (DMT)-like permease